MRGVSFGEFCRSLVFVLFCHRCFNTYILWDVFCCVLVVVPFFGIICASYCILFCIMSTWHDLLIYFTSQRNVAVFFSSFSLCRCSVASFCLFYVYWLVLYAPSLAACHVPLTFVICKNTTKVWRQPIFYIFIWKW